MSVERLARRAGIELHYEDAFGKRVDVSRDTLSALLNALGYASESDASAARTLRELDERAAARRFRPVYAATAGASIRDVVPAAADPGCELYDESGRAVDDLHGIGYYDLYAPLGERARIVVAPARAYRQPSFDERNGWGVTAQVYSLCGSQTQGIGDFGALAELARVAADCGAWAVGMNPPHQLNELDPQAASPYSPLSRLHLNVLYIDTVAAARFLEVDVPAESDAPGGFVDYRAVAARKMAAFQRLFERFQQLIAAGGDARVAEFQRFAARDPKLASMARYQVLLERAAADSPGRAGSWLQFPSAWRDPESAAVRDVAARHPDRLEYFVFLQWLADRQLAAAAVAAADMPLGLYRDLAVGVDLGSMDVWQDQPLYAAGLSVGAPPDPLNDAGQDWGVPPMRPAVLAERGYEPMAALLRANMRHAGALRVDHVMGFQRLFCAPRGERGGAYLRYDFDAMLAVCKIESTRARCAVVGEDLGTVPPGFRDRLRNEGIFSCAVLLFERQQGTGEFYAPERYEHEAAAGASTHDLPTLAGFRHGSDIAVRRHLGWISDEQAAAERSTRRRDLRALAHAFVEAGISEAGVDAPDERFIENAYAFLARAPSRLVLVQLEDVCAMREQVNVPGTVSEAPNWRRRLPESTGELARNRVLNAIAATMNRADRAAREDAS